MTAGIFGNSVNQEGEPAESPVAGQRTALGVAVRVMYVEDCPRCGCAMVVRDALTTPLPLVAADACPDNQCACHVCRVAPPVA